MCTVTKLLMIVRLAWMAVRGSDVDKEDSTLYMDAPCRSQEESDGPRHLKSTGLHDHFLELTGRQRLWLN